MGLIVCRSNGGMTGAACSAAGKNPDIEAPVFRLEKPLTPFLTRVVP